MSTANSVSSAPPARPQRRHAVLILLACSLGAVAQDTPEDSEPVLPSEGFQVTSQAELLGVSEAATAEGPQDGTFAIPEPPAPVQPVRRGAPVERATPITPADAAAAAADDARGRQEAERRARAEAERRDAQERAAQWVQERAERAGMDAKAIKTTNEAPDEAKEPDAPGQRRPGRGPRVPARVPWWYELPLKTRRDLPEIQMTVHFYSDDPTERFVKLNGERYGEGEDVDGPLRVREIRRQGVVLQFRRELFLYANQPG